MQHLALRDGSSCSGRFTLRCVTSEGRGGARGGREDTFSELIREISGQHYWLVIEGTPDHFLMGLPIDLYATRLTSSDISVQPCQQLGLHDQEGMSCLGV